MNTQNKITINGECGVDTAITKGEFLDEEL